MLIKPDIFTFAITSTLVAFGTVTFIPITVTLTLISVEFGINLGSSVGTTVAAPLSKLVDLVVARLDLLVDGAAVVVLGLEVELATVLVLAAVGAGVVVLTVVVVGVSTMGVVVDIVSLAVFFGGKTLVLALVAAFLAAVVAAVVVQATSGTPHSADRLLAPLPLYC
jgi:hypothetical protein